MTDFTTLKNEIDKYRNLLNIGNETCSPTNERILETEKTLNAKLPPSYLWFLKNYGGGEILGDEIYSIYDDKNVVGGDISFQYITNLKTATITEKEIPILSNDFGELYVFDCNNGPEFHVFKKLGTQRNLYADNFAKFLEKLLKEYSST
jgi:antitoxin YobK